MAARQLLGGRYRLLKRLGEGGMSVVWRAYDLTLDRPVAVKLLTARYLAHGSSRQRIRAEAQAAAGLSHPHITGVYDYGEARTGSGATVPYVVMELLTGSTLAERLRGGPLPVRTALQVCAQVASALAAAHGSGLVHRDVKPANVMLTPVGAKVLDFGLAAAAGAPDESLSAGEVWGTPAYLAPERLIAGMVVPASDVYALGLLLYAALTGERPWPAETLTGLLRAHRYAPPAPLPPIGGLPDRVVALCHRCLAKQPDDRPAAHEVARVLAEAVGWRVSPAVMPRSGTLPDRLAAGYARHLTDGHLIGRYSADRHLATRLAGGRPPARRAPAAPVGWWPGAPVGPDGPGLGRLVRPSAPDGGEAFAAGEPGGFGADPTVALDGFGGGPTVALALGRRWRRHHRPGAAGGRLRAVALAGSAAAVVVSLSAGLWLVEDGGAGTGAVGLGAPVWAVTPVPSAPPEAAAGNGGPVAGAGHRDADGGDPVADPVRDSADRGAPDPGGTAGGGESGTGSGGAASPSTSPVAGPQPSPSGSPVPSGSPGPLPGTEPPPATEEPTEPEPGTGESGNGESGTGESGEPVTEETGTAEPVAASASPAPSAADEPAPSPG